MLSYLLLLLLHIDTCDVLGGRVFELTGRSSGNIPSLIIDTTVNQYIQNVRRTFISSQNHVILAILSQRRAVQVALRGGRVQLQMLRTVCVRSALGHRQRAVFCDG
jgi:hypothetical protein